MKDKTEKTTQLTVRLPNDLIQFVESFALAQCNGKSGIVKLAITKLKESLEPTSEPQPQDSAA